MGGSCKAAVNKDAAIRAKTRKVAGRGTRAASHWYPQVHGVGVRDRQQRHVTPARTESDAANVPVLYTIQGR